MVRIRLRRVGSTHQPAYRLVAADRESPRDGRFLEQLGFYNPRTRPATIKVDEARAYHWLRHGAQPSESVVRLFKVTGTLVRFERLKQGENEATLLEEAKQSEVGRTADVRTRRDETVGSAGRGISKKAKAKAAAAQPESA